MNRRERVALAMTQARDALHAGAMSTPNADHIGDLVWFDPSRGWMAECSEVDDAWRSAGLDPSADLPKHTDYRTAFGRAVDAVRGAIHPKGFTLIDAAPINGSRRIGIVRVSRNGRVTTEDMGTIALPAGDVAPHVERADNASAEEIAQTVLSLTSVHRHKYTTDDLRNALNVVVDRWAGLPCRQCPPHVVYWLPAPAAHAIRTRADIVQTLGWGTIQIVSAHRSDARSLAACQSAASQGIEAKLSAFAADAAKYAAADHAKTRESTIQSRLEEAKALREQADLYRAILGGAILSIDDRVSAVEASLRNTLAQVIAAA